MTNNLLSDPSISYIHGIFPDRFRVFWLLGNFCPYECSYCPQHLHSGTVPYQDADVVIRTMKKLPKGLMFFSGGEPTYHPDFERIIDEKPEHVTIGLISNATRPLAFWERITPNIFSAVLTYHIEYAQFDRFLSIATLVFKTHNKPGRVNLTMLPSRWDECLEVYNKIKDAGISIIAKPILENFGKDSERMLPEYTDDQISWMTIASRSTDLDSSPVYAFNDKNELVFGTSCAELIATKQINFKGWRCDLPSKYISISPAGEVYNTTCAQGVYLGNINTGFELDTNSMICQQSFCSCFFDICGKKSKIAVSPTVVDSSTI